MSNDINFKFPHILTRSKAKINFSLIENNHSNQVSNEFVPKNETHSVEKRITRSTSKASVLTNNEFRGKGRLFTQKIKKCGSIGSDSGYNTNGSSSSKDCESVRSRDSGVSDLRKSVESLHTDDSNFSSNFSQSPPGLSSWRGPTSSPPGIADIVALREGNVTALVPRRTINGYKGQFKLNLQSTSDLLRGTLASDFRVKQMSPIVALKPHGVAFFDLEPAILVIPLKFKATNDAWLSVLYSNTSSSSEPNWQRLPRSDFYIKNDYVVVYLKHFSLFTVIEEEPFPEIMKKIRCRTGGRLRIPDVPGIEVNFPRGCLDHDIDACLRVLFDKEPLLSGDSTLRQPPASPIISLGPHGLNFSENRLPVLITLPIPEYEDIIGRCSTARLVAYQSSTSEDGDPMVWQRVDVDINKPKIIAYKHGLSGVPIPTVTFPVHHFSFFKVVWELLSSTLYEAKMGMSYFYPHVSFSMMCQAFMEESQNNRFGLEVICYRSDRKLPETTNYRHRVGASLKPKLVRPGRITVRLRSQMFEADMEAGEDEEMVKEEPDFRGRDFEKQYACRFKPDCCVERGPFGKVVVERLSTNHAPLFEFNLHKTGMETADNSAVVGCERWTAFAMKELAGSLQITEGNNWKMFAKHIGFTKSEIKNKLTYSADPFLAIMNMYNSRGGTPEEFVQALYVVSRDITLGLASGSNASPSSDSSRGSKSGSESKGSGSQGSSPMKKLWDLRPWAGTLHTPSESTASSKKDAPDGSSKRKRSLTEKKSGGSGSKKRKSSDDSDAPKSSSSGDEDVKDKATSEKHRHCVRKLNNKDLWRISSGIARKDWRNLGRTLGIEESVLINLEHSHQSVGFRECAYQMLLEWSGRKPKKCTFGELYSALMREKMNAVAKFMVRKISTEGIDNDSDSDD